jgi:hypothetical protein
MRTVPPSHLGSLREGLSLLRRHPGLALGLAVLAMLLAQLGPALELAAKAGRDPLFQPLFGAVGLLPLEMYFLPRLQARLDAERLDAPGNRAAAWTATFDGRWLAAFGVRMLLSAAVGVGLVLFILPGILLLTLYGWAPMRVLLRGDRMGDAFRWSQSAMARNWPRVVQAVLAMTLVLLVYQAATGFALTRLLPASDPEAGLDAWLRLRHPAFWAIGFLGGCLNLWLSASLLALFHRLEATVQASPSPSPR